MLLRGLADDKLFGALQGSFRVLQAGLLYPFSYEDVGDHLRAFVPGTARFVRAFRSIGMHFYGKSSASVMLAKGSNMHRAIYRNVHIVHPGTRDVLRVFSFADIYRWGGTASLFSLVVWDTTRDTEVELQLWTREGPTIAGLVVEYINTIMEDRATPALPKRSLGTSASD